MTELVLEILAELVSCDTQNPPRQIEAGDEIFATIRNRLGDQYRFELQDHGKGRIALLAVQGAPSFLFNVHLDTVPAGQNWTRPPLEMVRDTDRVFGRGVCDIKGAAACLLAAASTTGGNVALLFTTDEEGTESCCVEQFCRSGMQSGFQHIIVAEPTGCQVVTGHRGYLSVTGRFLGSSGHTSRHESLSSSANHRAARWISESLTRVAEFEQNALPGKSACFNIGRIDGGIKNNVIADSCRVTWSARLPSGGNNQDFLHFLTDSSPEYVQWETTFDGDPLTRFRDSDATPSFSPLPDLACGSDVDFWTEAAIFAARGCTDVIVLGPGHIEQAHTADEWIATDELRRCTDIYAGIMRADSG